MRRHPMDTGVNRAYTKCFLGLDLGLDPDSGYNSEKNPKEAYVSPRNNPNKKTSASDH